MPFLICRYARGMISGTGSTLFEELGLYYIGPVDGHNVDDLVSVLNGTMDGSLLLFGRQNASIPVLSRTIYTIINHYSEVKTAETVGPVLIHVITNKGQGYMPAEIAQVGMHRMERKIHKPLIASLSHFGY